ncbi:MAG TPA: hypothetical protein VFR12_02525 [Pyrinomonadaceae bacterium]|nr:hypothetical protein [Pyrinomonadaceae bacterium]
MKRSSVLTHAAGCGLGRRLSPIDFGGQLGREWSTVNRRYSKL